MKWEAIPRDLVASPSCQDLGGEGGSKLSHIGLPEQKRLLLKGRIGDSVSQRSQLA